MSDTIQFYASLPPIQSALKISGDGDNLRAQLDIPIRISPDGLRLALFTQKRLLITVQEVDETYFNKQDITTNGSTKGNRKQSKRTPSEVTSANDPT